MYGSARVALAWFGLVGSWLIGFVGGVVIVFRFIRALLDAQTAAARVAAVKGYIDQIVILDVLTAILVAGGAIVLVTLIVRIERRSAARDGEIRAALAAMVFNPSS